MQARSISVQQPSPIRQRLPNLSNPFEGLKQMEYQQVQPTILKKIKTSAPRPQKTLRTFSQQLQEAAQAYVVTSQEDYEIPTINLESQTELELVKPVPLTTEDFRGYMQKARNLVCTAEVFRQQAERMLERLEAREQQLNSYNQYLNLLHAEQQNQYKETSTELFSEEFYQQKQDVKNQVRVQNAQLNEIHSHKQKLQLICHEIYKTGFKMEVQHASYEALEYIAGQSKTYPINLEEGRSQSPDYSRGSRRLISPKDSKQTELNPSAFKIISQRLKDVIRLSEKQMMWIKQNQTIRRALEIFVVPMAPLDLAVVREQVDGVRQRTFRAMQRCQDTQTLLSRAQSELAVVDGCVAAAAARKRAQQRFVAEQLARVAAEVAALDARYQNHAQDITLINSEQLRSEANYELVRYSDRPENRLQLKLEDLELKLGTLSMAAGVLLRRQNSEAPLRATIDHTRRRLDELAEALAGFDREQLHRAKVLRGLRESKDKQQINAQKNAEASRQKQLQQLASEGVKVQAARPLQCRRFAVERRVTQQRILYNQVLQQETPEDDGDFYQD